MTNLKYPHFTGDGLSKVVDSLSLSQTISHYKNESTIYLQAYVYVYKYIHNEAQAASCTNSNNNNNKSFVYQLVGTTALAAVSTAITGCCLPLYLTMALIFQKF
uniref:Uncharacterized protein n=1 Tax=Glossina pallidipes TaxID=7398 RepID=A0A1A9ZIR5_GLOPL